MASSREDATSTSPVASTVVLRLKITLIRPGNGLNLGGINSHVFRPMMTACSCERYTTIKFDKARMDTIAEEVNDK